MFITLEGVEGCGKSTQAKALLTRLEKHGVSALLTHEPGGTLLGARIRQLLKKVTNVDIRDEAELFLFLASRAQLVNEVIRPNLEKGITVICDRYSESTVAYQGYGAGLSFSDIEATNTLATGGLRPDIVILLDLDPVAGLKRKRAIDGDRFERREIEFHRRVRGGYLKMAASEPARWFAIEASQKRKNVEEAIWGRIRQLI